MIALLKNDSWASSLDWTLIFQHSVLMGIQYKEEKYTSKCKIDQCSQIHVISRVTSKRLTSTKDNTWPRGKVKKNHFSHSAQAWTKAKADVGICNRPKKSLKLYRSHFNYFRCLFNMHNFASKPMTSFRGLKSDLMRGICWCTRELIQYFLNFLVKSSSKDFEQGRCQVQRHCLEFEKIEVMRFENTKEVQLRMFWWCKINT